MKKIFSLTILVLIIVYACKHQVTTPIDNNPGGGTDTTDNTGGNNEGNDDDSLVCFEAEILPIFLSSCAKSGCHDAATHEEGYILDSYEHIMRGDDGIVPGDASESEIYEVLLEDGDDRMPKKPNPPLLPEQIALIKKWINEGAQNTTDCAGECDTTQFTYSGAVREILDANCVNCHSGSVLNGGINLGTYGGVAEAASGGRLVGAITHAQGYVPMPFGGDKLGNCDITKITKWVEAGAPNN